jgi:hypothetical protein
MLLLLTFGFGLLLGLRYRVPSLLAASAVTVVVILVVAPLTGSTFFSALACAFGNLIMLQVGNLIGLLLSCALNYRSLPSAAEIDRPLHGANPIGSG